jgi:exosortase
VERWQGDDNYGHGWFVIPIALAILWQRRDRLAGLQSTTNWLRFLPLAGLLLARYWLYEKNEFWIECATIPVAFGCLAYALGGWPLIRWSWPALIFLFFMLPLPPSLNNVLAGSLQTFATYGSVNLLYAIGMTVISEGNVILVRDQRLEVAEACRGLSMLLSFATLITAMVILVRRPIWERVVLLVSIIPIALVCNIIRIAVTAVCYAKFGHEVKAVHDWAGLAMMPLALGFVVLEMKIMSWLVVEVDLEESSPALIRATYGSDPGPRS